MDFRFDGDLDDGPATLIDLVDRLAPAHQRHGGSHGLDLGKCGTLGADASAIFAAAAYWSASAGGQWFARPPQRAALRKIWDDSHLGHHFEGHAPPGEDFRDDAVMPVQLLSRAKFGAAAPIVDQLRRHVAVPDEVLEYFSMTFDEVVQNVEDHARSPFGCVAMARYMRATRSLRVAVVDHGLGIATTLRKRYPDTTDAVIALRRVTAGDYSAKARPNNLGQGVSNLCAVIVQNLGGVVDILSEDGLAVVTRPSPGAAHRVDVRPLANAFPGTGVFFSVPLAG